MIYYDAHALIGELERNLSQLKEKVSNIEHCDNIEDLGKIEAFARENIQALLIHGANISKGVKSSVEKRRVELGSNLRAKALDRVHQVLGE